MEQNLWPKSVELSADHQSKFQGRLEEIETQGSACIGTAGSIPFNYAIHALVMDALGLEVVAVDRSRAADLPIFSGWSRFRNMMDMSKAVRSLVRMFQGWARKCGAVRIHVLTPLSVCGVPGDEYEVYIDFAFEDSAGVFYGMSDLISGTSSQ